MTQDAGASVPGADDETADGGAVPSSVTDPIAGLDDLPVGEHVDRFAAVHDALRARLDGQDEPQGDQSATDAEAGA